MGSAKRDGTFIATSLRGTRSTSRQHPKRAPRRPRAARPAQPSCVTFVAMFEAMALTEALPMK
jgi:hypothetical protein